MRSALRMTKIVRISADRKKSPKKIAERELTRGRRKAAAANPAKTRARN
jgi:hypothetical protein